MDLLQQVTEFENTEVDCPLAADDCKLYFDSDNTRVVLKLAFKVKKADVKDAKIDVCCYGTDGFRLAVMDNIPYLPHGMLLEIPSLMTKYVAVVIRSAEFSDGTKWVGSSDFPQRITVDSDNGDEDFEDTHAFDSVLVEHDSDGENYDEEYDYEDYEDYDDSLEGLKGAERRAKRREIKRRKREEAEEIREFIKNDPTEKRKRRIKRLIVLIILILAAVGAKYGYVYLSEANTLYNKGMNLYNSGKFGDAATTLEQAAQYRFFGEKDKNLKWSLAMSYARERNFNRAEVYFKQLGAYKESRENYRSISDAMSKIAAAGRYHTIALKKDGTVVAAGNNTHGECSVENWSDVVQVCAGNGFTAGLTYDGKILIAGDTSRGINDAAKSDNVLFISSGAYNVLVTDINGHTKAYGGNDSNQGMTDLWKNIVAANGGETHSIGVSSDGTAFGSGGNESGQISLSDWNNIGLPSGTVTIRKGE